MTEDKIKEREEIDYTSFTKDELIERIKKHEQHIKGLNIAIHKERDEKKLMKVEIDSLKNQLYLATQGREISGERQDLEKKVIELENSLYETLETKRGYRGELRILKNKCDLLQIQVNDYRNLLIAFGEQMKDGKAE